MEELREEKSKTQIKKEAVNLQKIGEKLIDLNADQLSSMCLHQELEEAVLAAKSISSNSARRRQIQYIGALMRKIDPEPLLLALSRIKSGISRNQPDDDLSQLVQDLVQSGDSAFDSVVERYPSADRQKLGQLIRNARKNKDGEKAKKTFDSLKNYLKELDRL